MNTPRRRQRADTGRQLDAVDELIIEALCRDGRIANRALARMVGVNEASVRSRLRRLEKTSAVRVVAIRDLQSMGYAHVAAVAVQVKGRLVADVAADLAKVAEVLTVSLTIGANDIELQLVSRNINEMGDLISNVLANVPGVARLTPGLALKVYKYETQWAPLA